jgi:hypothetical protein
MFGHLHFSGLQNDHWHGLIVPGAVDGGPHNTIAAGDRWKASLNVNQPETTAWFHPHPHGETAQQVHMTFCAGCPPFLNDPIARLTAT